MLIGSRTGCARRGRQPVGVAQVYWEVYTTDAVAGGRSA
jgi:hypothetical protein